MGPGPKIEQIRHWSSRRGDHQKEQRAATFRVAAIADSAESPAPSIARGTPVLGATPIVAHGVGVSLLSPGARADILAGMAVQQLEWLVDQVPEPANRRRIQIKPIQRRARASNGKIV